MKKYEHRIRSVGVDGPAAAKQKRKVYELTQASLDETAAEGGA